MEVSHIIVAIATAISIALLVWMEMRSRRNSVNQQQSAVAAGPQQTQITQIKRPNRKRRRR